MQERNVYINGYLDRALYREKGFIKGGRGNKWLLSCLFSLLSTKFSDVIVSINQHPLLSILSPLYHIGYRLNFYQIKMGLYATFLTNRYGLKLKKITSDAEKKRVRLEYAQKLLSALNINVVVKGEERLTKEGQFLLISNHRSIIDPLIIEIAIKGTDIFGLWISKKELYNSFFFGLFTRNGGSILIDRESKEMSNFFKDIKSNVDNGNSIFLFPEGSRNKEETDLSNFKDGARIIALKNRLPILPVYIGINTNDVLKSALKKRQQQLHVTIEIGDYIDYKDRSVELEEAYRNIFNLQG